jgi:hypothetical protein
MSNPQERTTRPHHPSRGARHPPEGRLNDLDRLLDRLTLRTWASPSELRELGPLFTVLKRSFTASIGPSAMPRAASGDRGLPLPQALRESRPQPFPRPQPPDPALGMGDILLSTRSRSACPSTTPPRRSNSSSPGPRNGNAKDAASPPHQLRFTAPSQHYLSMSYGRPTCMEVSLRRHPQRRTYAPRNRELAFPSRDDLTGAR